MANVLVTGGAGYIGSVCCAELLRAGHFVTVVDDLSTGFREAIPSEAIFCEADVADTLAMRPLLSSTQFDAVFHFAAKALIPESVSNPGIFFEANVASGIVLLEELRRAKVRQFVFSSSAAVYGQPQSLPITEDHPTNPVNSYGETKLMFEKILSWYARAYGWGIAALRYFNASGASDGIGERHDPETHIIPLLLQAASGERENFKVFGTDFPTSDGTCLRDYVHVLDIADAHIRTLPLLNTPGMTILNIGTGENHSVKDMITVVEDVTGYRIPTVAAARRPGDPTALCASPVKLMQALGWKPKHSELRNIIQTAWNFHNSPLTA